MASRLSFREKVLQDREAAILASVKRLLADKGYDLMTVDEVAAEVGIAKASLYKHFASKEALAAAAMVQALEAALQASAAVDAAVAVGPDQRPLILLREMTRWALTTQLAGDMPILPAQNSTLRAALLADRAYTDRLMALSDRLGGWILQAQESGQISRQLPAEAVLYTLFARACDPVPGFLKAGGRYSDAQIIGWVLDSCFDGLAARAG